MSQDESPSRPVHEREEDLRLDADLDQLARELQAMARINGGGDGGNGDGDGNGQNNDDPQRNEFVEKCIEAVQDQIEDYRHPLVDQRELKCEFARQILVGLPKFRGEAPITHWLRRLLRTSYYTLLREAKGGRRVVDSKGKIKLRPLGERECRIADPKAIIDLAPHDAELAVKKVLQELAPIYRQIFMLKFDENLTTKEITSVVGLTENQVRSKIRTLYRAVREELRSAQVALA